MPSDDQRSPSFWDTVKSVSAAFFGVQSGKNQERDFSKGNPWAFIWIGILFVSLFILSIYAVVRIVLSQSGINP